MRGLFAVVRRTARRFYNNTPANAVEAYLFDSLRNVFAALAGRSAPA